MEERAEREGEAVEDTEYSAEGTDLHAHVAAGTLPEAFEQVAAVEKAREYGERVMQGADKLFREFPVTLRDEQGTINFGTIDAAGIFPGELRIEDLKFGYGALSEEGVAMQQWNYSQALAQTLDLRHLPIEVYVFQVRTGEELRASYRYSEAEVQDIRRIVDTSRADEGRTLRPSPGACRYCKAKTICIPFQAMMLAPAVQKQSTTAVSTAKMARLLGFASVIEPWAEALKAEANRRWDLGERFPGWNRKDVPTRSLDASAATVLDRLAEWLSVDDVLAVATLGVGNLEKKLGEVCAAKGLPKANARAVLSTALGDHLTVNMRRTFERTKE